MPGVRWHSAGMDAVPDDEGWMEPTLRDRLAGMSYTKRRDEARLGRWTAKNAVALALGLEPHARVLAEIHITNAPDGAPEVTVNGRPVALVVAMTDRADWAVCSLLAGTARVGCDLELVEPRSAAFVADYFTAAERQVLGAAPDGDLAANLLWSAKESALKVLRTGLRRDTRSVEVDVELPLSASSGWKSLVVRAAEGTEFPGWWVTYGAFILTVVAATDTERPEALVVPPPLASADPGHSWMRRPLVE